MEPPLEDAVESEPLLKYERVGGHFHSLFRDDALSCIAGHMNFICAGTFSGHVLLLELNGRYIRRLHQHHKKVQEISIDETGQHIVSCSDDGTVAVYSLLPISSEDSARVVIPTSGGEVNIYNFYNAVYSAQLEDGYSSKRERSFACGGISGQLILNKKGWIIDKENTIHEGEGPVHCIRYHEQLIAWANDWGVKVYDTSTDSRVTYIERPQNCPPFELCRAHLVWHTLSTSELTLFVGWGHTLRVVKIKSTTMDPAEAAKSTAFGALTAEVVSFVTFDFFVAGMSPWGDSAVCILAFRPPTTSSASQNAKESGEGVTEEIPCPEMHVIDLHGKQLAVDILQLRGYEKLRASDYRVQNLIRTPDQTPVLYLCTPKDVVVCRVRDVDDRVAYALSSRAYEKALAIALTDVAGLKRHALDELVEYYLGELILSKQYTVAADVCRRLLSPHLWEKYVYVFAQKGQLSAIAKFIPTSNPRLPTSQYEMVLKHFLETDPAQLLEIIRKWPKPRAHDASGLGSAPEYTETTSLFDPLYDPNAWINQLETVVRRRRLAESEVDHMSMETSYLMEALAELYTATEQYDHALRIYLSQGSLCTNKDHAFKLIVEHNLWASIQNKVVNLMMIDRESALRMLVHQIKSDQLKVSAIVKQLEHKRELLHEYLHNLFVHRLADYNTESYASLHELQVSLYAEFAPNYLLKFLQTSAFVPLERAYKFCSERSPPLWDAMIFILGRMGQHKKALDFIMTQLQNVKQAIQFVQDNDDELWDYLIEISLTNKEYIEELLEYACDHKIDPIKVMRKIPEDMEIAGLKTKVQQIIANYRIQLSLCHGCTKVFETDRADLLRRLITNRRKARRVTPQTQCGICFQQMKPVVNKDTNHFCVFECGHTYHLACLEEKSMLWKQADEHATTLDFGCFLCDHSSRRFTRQEPTQSMKGLTEQQLEVARSAIADQVA
ncbi:Aste57867_21416 [Aphanomyces stellatus]|uniref:Aste57867_21416 protein n=1 Tax=Aphanomyces stellatus TaxID=120398 RepID=A0A485LHE2_9STRA|nr:hypothetical protein As57867_021347 [Aphanomyces stellatus]VFT98087.1 Aste57867_21416 [Aphanomyces stellatus]